jgi:hypothetical protein
MVDLETAPEGLGMLDPNFPFGNHIQSVRALGSQTILFNRLFFGRQRLWE